MTGAFKILVVDDEEALRGIVTEVLGEAGYQTDTAANGREAIEKVKAGGGFHVVLTDIRMPELDGMELLEEVKKFDPNIQVVIMTSHGSLDTAIQAIRLGAYDYLEKPFEDLDVISTVINRTVDKLRLESEVKRLVGELRRRNEDVSNLYDCTAQLGTTLAEDEILAQATSHLARLGRCETAIYLTYQPDPPALKGRKATGWKGGKIEDLTLDLKGAEAAADYLKAIDEDTDLKKRMALSSRPQHVLLLPLERKDRQAGVFALAGGGEWTAEARALLSQFLGNVATHLEKAELHSQVADLAIRDGLTGLFNHRHFQNSLAGEIERARRFKGKLSLLLFDIDHFKKFNDANGHPTGDMLLREAGRLIRETLRKIDVAARYGGEEFVIIATETEKEGGRILAERIRDLIQKFPFPKRESQPLGFVSVSIGVAEYPGDANTKELLIEAADKALYKAKEAGRNRVVLADSRTRK